MYFIGFKQCIAIFHSLFHHNASGFIRLATYHCYWRPLYLSQTWCDGYKSFEFCKPLVVFNGVLPSPNPDWLLNPPSVAITLSLSLSPYNSVIISIDCVVGGWHMVSNSWFLSFSNRCFPVVSCEKFGLKFLHLLFVFF